MVGPREQLIPCGVHSNLLKTRKLQAANPEVAERLQGFP
jgi:hypothetical protein